MLQVLWIVLGSLQQDSWRALKDLKSHFKVTDAMQNFNDPSINYLGWYCMYTYFSLVKNLTSCLLFVFAYLLVHSLRIFTFHLLLFQVIWFSFFLRRKGQIGKVEVHSIPPQMSLQVSLSLITPHSDHCTLNCNHCDHCDYCTLTVIAVSVQ